MPDVNFLTDVIVGIVTGGSIDATLMLAHDYRLEHAATWQSSGAARRKKKRLKKEFEESGIGA